MPIPAIFRLRSVSLTRPGGGAHQLCPQCDGGLMTGKGHDVLSASGPPDADGNDRINRRTILLGSSSVLTAAALTSVAVPPTAGAQTQRPSGSAGRPPNILVLWGDDIGTWNISFNNRGMMGYMTPNIDRIAREGVGFTDYYGQQSCTAGRAAFLGGTVPVRTGMTKVGLPGAKEGWQ